MKQKYDTTVARIAGNIQSRFGYGGDEQIKTAYVGGEAGALGRTFEQFMTHVAVRRARLIVAETIATEPADS